MPVVTVRSRPNGLPIATTASPTSTCVESASVSGVRASGLASTLSRATSVDGSLPTSVAFSVSSFENRTSIEVAPSMTWKFVTTWPSLSSTKPEPSAWDDSWNWPADEVEEPIVEVICTTPGPLRL